MMQYIINKDIDMNALGRLFWTKDYYLAELKKGAISLYNVPQQFRDEEMCIIGVRFDSQAARYIPGEILTTEFCKKVIITNPKTILTIPVNKTKELWKLAVSRNCCIIKRVPIEYVDEGIFKLAIQNIFYEYHTHLEDIPSKSITSELCALAVAKNGDSIKYVPPSILSSELCVAAINNSPTAIKYISHEYLTEELCLLAVTKKPVCITLIPINMVTYDFYKKVLASNGLVLQYIREQTKELCTIAIKQNVNAIQYVNKNITLELLLLQTKVYNHINKQMEYYNDPVDKILRDLIVNNNYYAEHECYYTIYKKEQKVIEGIIYNGIEEVNTTLYTIFKEFI
jgi:hypothetical protein